MGLTFHVPTGIGDISWVYSKLSKIGQNRPIVFHPCFNNPKRAMPYIELLPFVTAGKYTRDYARIRNCLIPMDTDLSSLEDGEYNIGVNEFLELGGKLHKAFPKQPTDYHYHISLPAIDNNTRRLCESDRLKIGFYCSSYQHRRDAGFWLPDEWVRFLSLVLNEIKYCTLVGIGAPYDNRTTDVIALARRALDPGMFSFMDQSVGHTFNVMLQMDYFFAFPSGLGVMGDVLNVPTMMWFWGNLPGYPYMAGVYDSYADPVNIESGRHINVPYISPEESFKIWMEKGRKFVDG